MHREPEPNHTSAAAEQPSAPSRPIVLLVDDIPENLYAIEKMLEHDCVEILTAASGAAALEILLAREVGLALIDVQMPGMDGFTVAELMRGVEKTRHVPIIFVTAGGTDGARLFKGYEVGAVDFLEKPVDESILRSKVDVFVAIERRRQQQRHAADVLREANVRFLHEAAMERAKAHERERELVAVAELREMFMGILAHDLRNPLGSIVLGADLLRRRGHLDEQDERTLTRMVSSSKRMMRMISQLLDLTRARLGGGFPIAVATTDLRDVCRAVVDEFPTDLELVTEGDLIGMWDSDRLQEALSNVAGNAVAYATAGTNVVVSARPDDGTGVVIEISNQGEPIPPDVLPFIFEPFRQGQRRKTAAGNLGLGLFIAREITFAHGGTIAACSRDGTTSIVMRLPGRMIGTA